MSKLLKHLVKKHRPAIAALMTAKNGYDETKHRTPAELAKAGVVSKAQAKDLDDCFGDLSNDGDLAGALMQSASNGGINPDRFNDQDFLNEILGDEVKGDASNDGNDGDDDGNITDSALDSDVDAQGTL